MQNVFPGRQKPTSGRQTQFSGRQNAFSGSKLYLYIYRFKDLFELYLMRERKKFYLANI